MIKSVDGIHQALDDIETAIEPKSCVFTTNTEELRSLLWKAREIVDALDALEDHGEE